MNHNTDRRAFNRFPMEFVLEVSSEDSEGKEFNERTVLKDISGEGARFITQKADKYFLGQSLELTIHLPGSDEVKACMIGKATVLRIDPSSNEDTDEKSRGVGIAVKLDTPLRFERVDVKMQERSE